MEETGLKINKSMGPARLRDIFSKREGALTKHVLPALVRTLLSHNLYCKLEFRTLL